MVVFLLERGVDIDAVTTRYDGYHYALKRTLLHKATENRHSDVARLLLESYADVNARLESR